MTVTTTPKGRRASADFPSAAPPVEHLAKQRADRHDAVTETVSLVVGLPLAGLAAVEQHRLPPDEVGAFTLDIVTIESHKVPIADAVCDLAESYPVLGVVLDRLAKATPFGALFGLVMSLGVQIAENHRALPAQMRATSPNLVPRDELAARVKAESARQQAEREAAAKANNGS